MSNGEAITYQPMLSELRSKVVKLSRDIAMLQGERRLLETRRASYVVYIEDAKKESQFLLAARDLLQRVSTIMRVQLSGRFAELATSALQFIFRRSDLKFIVELDVKGNLPVATFFVEVGSNRADPATALGGSVYEIIGICLRLVCLEFFQLKGPLILDEPLRSVDNENLVSALEFIVQYCRTTNRQLFIVTHNSTIAEVADTLYEVGQEDGVSYVKTIERGE